ncbi:MAG: hypothetical protein EZS28_016920 [Streblomastix strix]|uniref:RRM domain-containing protein n=1 Tax=Streblomastix strix TaxID=222440 RepID=A0A5J4VYR6_9EUKA|nr:MAG: hypothetical protein EZS28_016920 [Streblomastix strix]
MDFFFHFFLPGVKLPQNHHLHSNINLQLDLTDPRYDFAIAFIPDPEICEKCLKDLNGQLIDGNEVEFGLRYSWDKRKKESERARRERDKWMMITGFPAGLTTKELMNLCRNFGNYGGYVSPEADDPRSSFGIVYMASQEDMEAAVQYFEGLQYYEHTLHARHITSKAGR